MLIHFLFVRNFFLDFDQWGYMAGIEQNFNPSPPDIKRREALGKSILSLSLLCQDIFKTPFFNFFFIFWVARLSPVAQRGYDRSDRHAGAETERTFSSKTG